MVLHVWFNTNHKIYLIYMQYNTKYNITESKLKIYLAAKIRLVLGKKEFMCLVVLAHVSVVVLQRALLILINSITY